MDQFMSLEDAVRKYPEEDFPNGTWFDKLAEATGISTEELGSELLAIGYDVGI